MSDLEAFFSLGLVRDPQLWIDFVATMLLGELSKHDPHLRGRLSAAAAP